ncbi:MAG: hypothetical protein KatS3mg050_1857 [Litorilinea sp.]|nr:MAG: hypothetical protein KatS3mg050_1857 [Litorilinea sp.]
MNQNIVPVIQSANKLFLSGPFGSGKTTLAIQRIQWLLRQERVRGDDILVLVPQRTLAQPYYQALRQAHIPPGPPVRVTTLAGLARASVELYWPLLAGEAGFADPRREPTFLDLETSQHHMARFIDAALEQGDFDGVRVERNRIISQVLDNLNKAALHGFSIDEAYDRLELAVPGGDQRTARLNALRAARRISHQFRQLCLEATLIDFSLQIVLFNRHVLTNPWSRTHLFRSHQHLIFDNVEEDTAAAHHLVQEWLPFLETALLISDSDGGYRFFLGADPQGAARLADHCPEQITLHESYVMSPALERLAGQVEQVLRGRRLAPTASAQGILQEEAESQAAGSAAPALLLPEEPLRFYPQMIGWVVKQIRHLVAEEGVPPGEIAVLAPFVSDALRFSLQQALGEAGIPSTTHRPSRALEDEPAARCLLTLAALAHPTWGIRPAPSDVTQALVLAVSRLDPVRGHLLSRIVYPERRARIDLGRFGDLVPEMQERITYTLGEAYDRLRDWIYAYRASGEILPLDQFFARLFGEVLSQPGFGFHEDHDAARVANQLVQSARNFRWAMEESAPDGLNPAEMGRDYLHLVESGALAALYVPGWREPEDAVFLAPAYTFLMRNRAVDVQFWLDIGSSGWWERLYQPLTHPYVLQPGWPAGRTWSDFDEYTTRQETLRRLLLGLIRRTRRQIYLSPSDYSESGFEQRGPLLNLVNRLLLQLRATEE